MRTTLSKALLLVATMLVMATGCRGRSPSGPAPDQGEQLREALASEQFLDALGTDEFVILRQYSYRVVIETRGERPRIWEVVFTISDGWRLRRDGERLVLIPGEGYQPAP